jgi:hypothetical protein
MPSWILILSELLLTLFDQLSLFLTHKFEIWTKVVIFLCWIELTYFWYFWYILTYNVMMDQVSDLGPSWPSCFKFVGCPLLNPTDTCTKSFVRGNRSDRGDFIEIGSIIKTFSLGQDDYLLCQEDGTYNSSIFCLKEDKQGKKYVNFILSWLYHILYV